MIRFAKRATSVAGNRQLPSQAALASLIESGLLARHVAKARRVYAERHERILCTLVADFAEWLTPVRSLTGMHLSAVLRSRSVRVEGELAARAAREGVAFDRLSRYYATARKKAGVVLGYGAITTHDITEGLRRLRHCCAAAHWR
ncbi:MAG: hypothetical protein KY432_05765 [Acidobacteria bacterium]|nr:hypothetical protein [Acidobacteriota bacterium]